MDFLVLNDEELKNTIMSILLMEESGGNNTVTIEDFEEALSLNKERIEKAVSLAIKNSYCTVENSRIKDF